MKIVGIFIFVILLLSLKGALGNVTPTEISGGLMSAGKPFELSPERNRYAQVLMFAKYHTFFLPKELAIVVTPDLGYKDGKFVSIYPPGMSVFATPLYLIGTFFGMGQLFVFLTSAVFSLGSFLLIVIIGRVLKIDSKFMIISGLLFIFGTSVWAYSTSFYQHIVTAFLVLVLFGFTLLKNNTIHSLAVWFVYAMAGMVDYSNFLIMLPLIIVYFSKYIVIKFEERTLNMNIKFRVVFTIIGILPVMLPWGIYNYLSFGDPFFISKNALAVRNFDGDDQPVIAKSTVGTSSSTMFSLKNISRGISVLTISFDRGVFVYSPYLIIGMLGISKLKKKNIRVFVTLILFILSVLIFYGLFSDPWGGWAFGPRYLIPAMAAFSFFVGMVLRDNYKNKCFILVFYILSIISIGINGIGAFTSNQILYGKELLLLGKKAAILQSLEYFNNGVNGSFIFETYMFRYIHSQYYIFGILIVLSMLLTILLIKALESNEIIYK